MAEFYKAWMPFFVADYLRDTRHLSAAEHGAYVLLILEYWERQGPLPDDDRALAHIARMTADEWAAARPTVTAFFKAVEKTLVHKRVSEELRKAKQVFESARKNGSRGGKAKSRNSKPPSSDPLAVAKRPLSEPSSHKKEERKEVRKEDPSQEIERLGEERKVVGGEGRLAVVGGRDA